MTADAASAWTFATALYAREAVAPALLDLQERGADVLIVLLLLYLGQSGRTLDDTGIATIDRCAERERTREIEPLRAARRAVRAGRRALRGGGEAYAAAKHDELAAERRQLDRLVCEADTLTTSLPSSGEAMLRAYLGARGIADDQAVAILAAAR